MKDEEKTIQRNARLEKRRTASLANAKIMRKLRVSSQQKPFLKIQTARVNVGCSGWFYWHWSDKFYQGIETKDWFKHYLKNFNTVELNAPFYSWPAISTVKTWLRQAKSRKNFIYTVKVSELITHIKKFQGTRTLIKDFYYIATLLGERMGCFLFQLPPSFHYTPARLKNILSQLDNQYRNVIEFRHQSWWRKDVYRALKKHKIIFCSLSSPKMPEELMVTADEIYLRFHGNTKMYLHNYTKQDLQVWSDKLSASKAKIIWAYFNNDREGYAINNAKTLAKMLSKSSVIKK